MPRALALLMLLVACDGGTNTTVDGGGDGGGSAECGPALGRWDAAHPLPASSFQVPLAEALISGPGGVAADPAADGNRGSVGGGTLPYEIVIELAEPVPVVGVRHYPASSGTALSHFRVHLGDDGACDAEAGEPVVPLGPFFEDFDVTPRVAQRVRLELREAHGGAEDFSVDDIQILAGAAFLTEPTTALRTEEPWQWDASVRIPGVGPIRWSLMDWPTGLEVDTEGMVTWTPHISQGGEHVVHIFAARGEARIDVRVVLSVTVP